MNNLKQEYFSNTFSLVFHLLLLQVLCFQTHFVANTNACEQRESHSKAGEARGEGIGKRGQGFGQTRAQTMNKQEFIGQRPRQGISRERGSVINRSKPEILDQRETDRVEKGGACATV